MAVIKRKRVRNQSLNKQEEEKVRVKHNVSEYSPENKDRVEALKLENSIACQI